MTNQNAKDQSAGSLIAKTTEGESSLFLQAVINAVADPIFVKNHKHELVFVNEALCALIGCKREDLIGRSDNAIFPPDQAADFRSKDDYVFATGQLSIEEEQVTDLGGKTHLVSTKKSLVVSPSGERLIVGVVRDISDQQSLRRRLEEDIRRDRLRHVGSDFDETADFESICQRLVAEICDLGSLAAGLAYRVRPGLGGTWSLRPIGSPYIRTQVIGSKGLPPKGPLGPTEAPQFLDTYTARLADEYGMLRIALGLGEPFLLSSLPRGQDDRCDAALRAGYEALIALPLSVAGENIAVLEFYTARGRGADAGLVQSVEEILQRVGLILQRNATMNRMRESEALKGAIISSSMDGLIVIDSYGYVVEFNPGAERIFGYRRDQVLGSDIARSIIPDHHVDSHVKALKSYVDGRPLTDLRRRVEIDGKRQDGETIPIELSITFIEANGRRLFAAFVRDLSEKKAAEATIAQQQAKIISSAKMSELGTMASGIAHEINNPLAVIHGKAQKLQAMMQIGPLDPELLKKDLRVVEDTATRIAKIVRGLRSFARDGAKDPYERVAIKTIIEETLELCAARFKHHGVELRQHPTAETLTTDCRPVQISQVLLNLLNNSFDAVHTLPQPWIAIKVTEEDGSIRIAVQDSGPGIAPEHRPKATQPFFTTKAAGKGTGLGLSISRAIVEDHGGRLVIDDLEGRMRISVLLPRVPPR